MDLLYQPADGSGLKVAQGKGNGRYSTFDYFKQFVISAEKDENCQTPSTEDLISMPDSNAFIDFDGDCMPDLFLTRQSQDK